MLERGEASLSGEINAATRNLHTTLNRLITSRLPLALPPHAPDPTLYTTGLLHFAHVFLTFESLWADLARHHSPRAPCSDDPAPTSTSTSTSTSPPLSPLLSYLLVNPYDSPSFFTATLGAPTSLSPYMLAFLQALRPRGLVRSAHVKRDLEHLMNLHPTDLDVVLAKYPGDKVATFCTHIRKAVHEKPWTLVSYAWCFYMAVFSGGRWIRAELLKAGPAFWQVSKEDSEPSTAQLPERGLSLWHFPGQFDGEDIKVDFKTRLATAETLFTPDQRVDIIEEAKNIFKLCASLVQELDDMVGAESAPPDEKVVEKKVDADADEQDTALLRQAKNSTRSTDVTRSDSRVMRFVRRPQVTGTLVALACFACIVLLNSQ